jgi:mRNA interferase HigB
LFKGKALVRIIATSTLCRAEESYPDASGSLRSWQALVKERRWNSPQDVKYDFPNASIIANNRVIFNIKGNHYRLIVKIEYKLQIVFITWFGNHKEYDNINAETIEYEKP